MSFDLKNKILKIKSDIKKLIAANCHERYRVDWYGAYHIHPKYLVFWICVETDEMKIKLSEMPDLHSQLRDLLISNDYPIDARESVSIGFESQETVDRESNGNSFHHFK
jgi:hypothetical protein